MRKVKMNYGSHHWEKQNMMTKKDRNGMFDEYVCSCCGIKGKSYTLGYIDVLNRYDAKLRKCKGAQKTTRVKVVHCEAVGPQFSNLTDGSIHDVITPPSGQKNKRGEWVMGVGEPVLLLANEYIYI